MPSGDITEPRKRSGAFWLLEMFGNVLFWGFAAGRGAFGANEETALQLICDFFVQKAGFDALVCCPTNR